MADMGLDFAPPKMTDVKAWGNLKNLFVAGVTFHSCGCSGPGYIPKSNEALVDFLNSKRAWFFHNLKFWRSHNEPSNTAEVQRDWAKNGEYLAAMPVELRNEQVPPSNHEAVSYWISRIEDIDSRIKQLPPA